MLGFRLSAERPPEPRRVNDVVVTRIEHVLEVAPELMTEHVHQQDIPNWDLRRIVAARWEHLAWMHDHFADAVLSGDELLAEIDAEGRAVSGWKLAHVDEVPALGDAATPEYWQAWTDGEAYVRGWRSVRTHLGLAAFGVNAKEAAAGQTLVVAHNEDDFGRQEELYFVFAGRARFVLDGTAVEVGAGGLLFVVPSVEREAVALETPTKVLMIGGVPGAAYVPE